MPTPDLAAYDRVGRQLALERETGRLEARVRRRLRRPDADLAWTLALIALCAGASLVGVANGWMVALGLLFAVLPSRLEAVRRRRQALAAVESSADVHALVLAEARTALGRAGAGMLAMGGLGLLYALVGGVAWLLGKSPWPGLVAGGLCLGWAAFELTVRIPRAARELRILGRGDARAQATQGGGDA